ncbi:MAG: class II glutamine amidotransferase [Sulfuriferula sp.]
MASSTSSAESVVHFVAGPAADGRKNKECQNYRVKGIRKAVLRILRPNSKAQKKAVCRPDGQTDSEYAFCYLLGHIAQQSHVTLQLTGEPWLETVARVAEAVASYGQFNFLISDGEYLVAYAHDRLYYLERHDQSLEMGALEVALIATEPLPSCAPWLPFEPGELRIYRHGRLVGDMKTYPPLPPKKAAASH